MSFLAVLRHALDTPWTQLTLTDVGVAIATYLAFNILITLIGLPFGEAKHEDGGTN